MEQLKKRMARERQEREDEFRLKEEQIRRERTIREQSMRKRNDRLSFLRRSNTSTGLFSSSSYTSPNITYSSFSSYSSDSLSPTSSYSYSANLAAKWADVGPTQEKDDKEKTENGKNGDATSETSERSDDKDSESSLPFTSYNSNHKPSEESSNSTKKKYEAEEESVSFTGTYKRATPVISDDYISSTNTETDYKRSSNLGGERISTRYFPNVPTPPENLQSEPPSYVPFTSNRKSTYGTTDYTGSRDTYSDNHNSRDSPSPISSHKSFESSPLSSYSGSHTPERQYGSRRGSEYESAKSAEPPLATSGRKPYEFSSFSNYLNSDPDLQYGGSRGTSPIFASHRSDHMSPPPPTNNSSRSTDDLLSNDKFYNSSRASSDDRQNEEYGQSRESWTRSLPRRKSSRMEEQIEWEKQFYRERERKNRVREEEELREEERLKMELKSQEILQNQKAMKKKRWEDSFATNFTKPTYDDHHSTGFVEYKQYNFRPANVESVTPEDVSHDTTSSYTSRYNNDKSTSYVKQFRSVHSQTSVSSVRPTPEGG